MDVKELLKNEAIRIYNEIGSLKKDEYAKHCKKGLGIAAYRKYFKSHNDFLKYCGIPINKPRNYSKEEIDNEIIRLFNVAKENNEKFSDAFIRKNSNFTLKPIYRIYHNFNNLVNSFDGIKEYNDQFEITKEKIINDLISTHELSKKLNEKFNLRFYQKHTKYSLSYLYHYFNSYQDAINELNLTNNVLPTPTKEEYLKEIKQIYDKFNYMSLSLLVRESRYKHKGIRYLEKFGGYLNILSELNIPSYKDNVFSHSKQVFYYAEQYLKCKPVYEKKWDWLVSDKTGYKLPVDCYFEDKNLIIEYHGRQHYEYNKYFHKSYDDFLNYKYNDNLKKSILTEKGFIFIEFPYYEKISYDNVVKIIDNHIYNRNAESSNK